MCKCWLIHGVVKGSKWSTMTRSYFALHSQLSTHESRRVEVQNVKEDGHIFKIEVAYS